MNGQTVRDFIMTMPDMCKLLQRSRIAVYTVMKRYPDFPEAMERGHGTKLIWLKADVMAWYEEHKQELEASLERGMKSWKRAGLK